MQTFENNAWYAIAAKAGGKVITAEGKDNGAPISIEENQDKASQLWSITAEGDYYKIVNKESGKALDVVSLGTANGTYLHQWDFAGGKSQLWKIEERDTGAMVIRSAHSLTIASTMDICIIKELFESYLDMCSILGITGLSDKVLKTIS